VENSIGWGGKPAELSRLLGSKVGSGPQWRERGLGASLELEGRSPAPVRVRAKTHFFPCAAGGACEVGEWQLPGSLSRLIDRFDVVLPGGDFEIIV
jgi:hypothetical protein